MFSPTHTTVLWKFLHLVLFPNDIVYWVTYVWRIFGAAVINSSPVLFDFWYTDEHVSFDITVYAEQIFADFRELKLNK